MTTLKTRVWFVKVQTGHVTASPTVAQATSLTTLMELAADAALTVRSVWDQRKTARFAKTANSSTEPDKRATAWFTAEKASLVTPRQRNARIVHLRVQTASATQSIARSVPQICTFCIPRVWPTAAKEKTKSSVVCLTLDLSAGITRLRDE